MRSVGEIALAKRDPEIVAYDRQSRKEEEVEDIEIFLDAYERATGEKLEIDEVEESPDAICRRPDGSLVGVEHTRIRRSPEAAHWAAVLDHQDEMGFDETLDEIDRMISQKCQLLSKFRTQHNILLIALYESDFDSVVRMLECFPLPDAATAGFDEIWLADFKGIREGAHREARLFGIFPARFSRVTERSSYDQKPFG